MLVPKALTNEVTSGKSNTVMLLLAGVLPTQLVVVFVIAVYETV